MFFFTIILFFLRLTGSLLMLISTIFSLILTLSSFENKTIISNNENFCNQKLIFENLNKHLKFTELFIRKKKFDRIEIKNQTSQIKQIEQNKKNTQNKTRNRKSNKEKKKHDKTENRATKDQTKQVEQEKTKNPTDQITKHITEKSKEYSKSNKIKRQNS